MKKHFLLLLMAFFSLTGWAQTDLSQGWEIVFVPESPQTYTGLDQTPVVKLKKGDNYLTTGFNVEWSSNEIINAGSYTVTVTADNTTTYDDLESPTKKFWILKANNRVNNTPVLSAGGAYVAAGFDLITTAPTLAFNTVEVQYMVTDNATVPAANAEGWTTTRPHMTKPGTYYVYIKADADPNGNFNALAPQKILDENTVTITGTNLVEGTDYTAPTALGADIAFDNADHDLINGGRALTANCTMKYKLGDGGWETTVPTGKIADNYTVYWKAEAAAGYNDVTGSFNATIIAAQPTIGAATAATGTLTYKGVAQSLLSAPATATIGATPNYTIAFKAPGAADFGAAGEAVAYAAVKGTAAGTYKITPVVAAGGNYLAANGTAIDVVIGKADLTVKTDNKTMGYGEAVPTFTASYTGFQNGETAETAHVTAPTLTCKESDEDGAAAVGVTTAQGTYKIKATEGTGSADNYNLVFNEANYGTLTISPKELNEDDFIFTLTDATKVYTGEALTTTIASAKYGTTDLTSPADYTYLITNNINAGKANVIISGQGNFKGSVVRNFTITPKPVYVQPLNAEKSYGTATDPALEYEVYGAPGVEASKIENATLNGTVELARVAGENAGTYKIYVKSFTITEGSTANYTIATDANTAAGQGQVLNTPNSASDYNLVGLFTVKPAAGEGLVLKFKDDIDAAKKTKVYGDANPAWAIADLEIVSGLIGDDDAATVLASLSTPTFELTSEDVDDDNQVVLKSGLLSANYPTVTVTPMDFTVTARPITVTVENQTITYGNVIAEANNGVNWNITTGTLAAGDVIADLNLSLKTVNDIYTYAVAAEPYAEAITAEIENDNYALTVVKGSLTVNSGAAITLATTGDMDALISAYNGQNIAVSLNRALTRAETWYAMVLPFETSVAELSTKYGYAVVNVLNETNDDASKVKFKLHMQTIAANQPFLIKIAEAQAADAAAMAFGARDIEYAAEPMSKDAAGNKFHGVFKTTELAASEKLWVMIPSQNKFMKLDKSGTKLNPTLAYLETKNSLDAFAPVITVEDFDFNSGTTSIKALNTDTMKAYSTDGWYNLNGVKLQGVPTQKGVYIQNGKKVIIK